VKNTIERLTILHIRGKLKDPLRDLHSTLLSAITDENKTEQLLEPQLNRYMHTCLLWLKEFFNIFSFNTYIPVYGPLKPKIKISKTPMQLDISGVYRSKKNQTLHIITFATYNSEHSMINDPTLHLKLNIIKPLVKEHTSSGRPQAVIHSFGYGKNDNLNYYSLQSDKADNNFIKMIELLVKQIEDGYHFPVIPCNHRCKYKSVCFPKNWKNNE